MAKTLTVRVSARVRRYKVARRLIRLTRVVPWMGPRLRLINAVLWMVRPEYRVDGGKWKPLTGRVRASYTGNGEG